MILKKGMIDASGNLSIDRAGEMKEQYCPFDPTILDEEQSESVHCGDWCPLFGEPCYVTSDNTSIEICRRILGFEVFKDMR